ncbi:Pre-mRNA-splicing factor cwf23 [Stagonosporopsis vannaccii]|nr:Pre-mRNA-splicing factor cwf23 [Stagonosporopsis vannaccii]
MGDNFKDLEELARSTTEDYYELLSVPFDAEESVIKRAYRKASIRYHPDKNPDNKDAADRFIALGWARDILIDPKLKGEYDRARTRRREKAFQDELLSGNRRKMKEELERRERESADFGASLKRKRAADLSEAEKREQEIQRLAEDGKRRRKEAQDRKDKARKEEEAAAAEPVKSPEPQPPRPGDSAELDRTVKIRFHRDGQTATWDKDTIRSMFDKYGKIDSIIMGKDKKLKLEGEKHRKLVAMVFVVYSRLDHAHAAVSDAKAEHPALDSVAWANGEPDLSSSTHTNGTSTSTSRAPIHNPAPQAPSTPAPPSKSFRASFNSSLGAASGATPLGTPKFSFSPKTPSLEEVTMMRLKNAEKKRLEEQIRKKEAAEAAQEAAV